MYYLKFTHPWKKENPFPNRPWMLEHGAASITNSKHPHHLVFRAILVGAITGSIEVVLTYPTDYVKTQLQLDGKHGRKRFEGVIDCLVKTVEKHGIFGLYRGMFVLFLGAIPKTAIRFGSFEYFKAKLKDEKGYLKPSRSFLSGLAAGAIEAVTVITPMETIKVRFIQDRRRRQPIFKSFLHGVGTIVAEKGPIGLYKGLTATVVKQSSNQGLRFLTMETLKDWYKTSNPEGKMPRVLSGVFGVIAGAVSVFGNTPIDVIKTRMQGRNSKIYSNSLDCAIKTWKLEGPTAFYKGLIPRLCRVCLDVGVTFYIFDLFIDIIGFLNSKK